MCAQGIGHFRADLGAHELAEVGLVMQRVATLAIRIKPLHLALRTGAGRPHEEKRLPGTVGVLDSRQPANAADIRVGILGKVKYLCTGWPPAIDAAEDGAAF